MSSPTQGMWTCRHNVDGRDFCPECCGPDDRTHDAKAALEERAESYSQDARKFADAARLGKPVIDAESDQRWVLIYRTVADELRKAAAGQGSQGEKS